MGLREYLEEVERRSPDQIVRIDREVDPRYEITAAVTLLERRGPSPILWFTKVKGTNFPVVVNVTGSKARVGSALGVSSRELVSEYLSRSDQLIPPIEIPTSPVKEE